MSENDREHFFTCIVNNEDDVDDDNNDDDAILKQAVVQKQNKPRPRIAHCGIARFLRIDPKLNHVVPWLLHTFPENFMQIGSAVFS